MEQVLALATESVKVSKMEKINETMVCLVDSPRFERMR